MSDHAMDEDDDRNSIHESGSLHAVVYDTDPEGGLGDELDQNFKAGIMKPFDLFLNCVYEEIDSHSGSCSKDVSVQLFGKSVWSHLPEDQRSTFARATEGINRQYRRMGGNAMDEENSSQLATRHKAGGSDPFEIFLEYITQEMQKQGMYQQLDPVEKREIALQMWSEMMEQQKQPYVDAARSKDVETRRLGKEEQEKVRRVKEKEQKLKEIKKKAEQKAKAKGYEEVPPPCRHEPRKDGTVTHSQSAARESESETECSKNQGEEPKKKVLKSILKKPKGKVYNKRKKATKCSNKSAGRKSKSDSERSDSQDEEPKRKRTKSTSTKRNGKQEKEQKARGKKSRSDSESSESRHEEHERHKSKSSAKGNGKRAKKSAASSSSESAGCKSRSDSESSKSRDEKPRRNNAKSTTRKPTAKGNQERHKKKKASSHCSPDEDSDSLSQGRSQKKKQACGDRPKSAAKPKGKPGPKKRGPVKKYDTRSKSAPSKSGKK